MAKYVGKIFKVNDKDLKIRGNGSHFIHVTWYNPFKRKFRCKVITSLEDKKVLEGKQIKSSRLTPHVKRGNIFNLFKKKKYNKLRNGHIQPIPITKTEGFDVWSGYDETRDLDLNTLKSAKIQPDKKIKK